MKIRSCHFGFLSILALISSACSTTSKIKGNSTVYNLREPDLNQIANDSLFKITTKTFQGIVEVKTDYLLVKPNADESVSDNPHHFLYSSDKLRRGFRAFEINKFYFPESSFDSTGVPAEFKFRNLRFGLQALTVAFKFRNGFRRDTSRYYPQVETGFNFAFAPGFKQSWNSYKDDKDIWGSHIRTFSFTSGGLLGGSAVDLSSKNAPSLVGDRKSALYSLGLFAMFGYGKINVGYAVGWDWVAGAGRKYWIYQGKHWNGFIIALELLKF